MYRPRLLEAKISELFRFYPVISILGARQVGKSTLVENLFGTDLDAVVFDPVLDIEDARHDPDFFLQNHPPPVFLDEIQYAPEVLGAIKRRVDRNKQAGQYILSGSQNLAVLKSISESLAGRVAIAHLLPMTRQELAGEPNHDFLSRWLAGETPALPATIGAKPPPQLYPAIRRGGYPGLLNLPDHLISGYWQSYLHTYIERDVRMVAQIGSLQTFGQFISLLAALSSQEVNHANLGRELGVDRKTSRAWLETAQATFLWFAVPAFTRNPIKRIAGKAKGYFADPGFICHLQKIGSGEVIGGHPLKGALFETYVVMEILKTIQAWPMPPNLYHFRSYGGAEVDLILEQNGVLHPIEIKAKSNPTRNDGRGIGAFRECFPTEQIGPGLIVCAVEKPRRLAENLFAIPWWMI